MISRAHITAWRGAAPWSTDAQVEQDLVLSRALVEIFSDPVLKSQLAFRGGTALYKLQLLPAPRYSEDIDLVQTDAGAIGPVMTALHARLDHWLGEPRRKQGQGVTFIYRFDSEIPPITPLRLKVEINTREHFSVHGFETKRFEVDSPWFSGAASLRTYFLEELLGTKLRALYQRKEGRDLFDLALALQRRPALDIEKTVGCFLEYMRRSATRVSRAEFEANLLGKMEDPTFLADIAPLLSPDAADQFDARRAGEVILERFISKIPGDSWKGTR
ncbi:MAG TPA: nucleotidyl transferase AbiEii/AbiGii toxin family protein [Bryobacteraceae bacterium]|nr:nucleotidyl transferase AbiEii/AbiGii toxin family protein [Bryobacteraceae bacterium]